LNQAMLIHCENLVRIYKVANLEVVALQGLDLTVNQGEMLAIVGNSGSGKSTLLNILGGLDRPSAGRVLVDDLDLLKLSDQEMTLYQRKKVGFVWQQTSRNLIPYLNAFENVELPMSMAWTGSQAEKKTRVEELLSAVGLWKRREHRMVQLSGGEQQRLAIAVALANNPLLLLGDEPTGEVDTTTAQGIMDTLRSFNQQLGLTIIIVTHDPRVAAQMDRVVAIRDGKISTETVRQPAAENGAVIGIHAPGEPLPEKKETHFYQEYVILDSAGRLQVPREWLEQLGIGRRANLKLDEDGIRIQAAEGEENKPSKQMTLDEQIAALFSEDPPKKKKR
jgi:putative ABC transport system ATP-binding protein